MNSISYNVVFSILLLFLYPFVLLFFFPSEHMYGNTTKTCTSILLNNIIAYYWSIADNESPQSPGEAEAEQHVKDITADGVGHGHVAHACSEHPCANKIKKQSHYNDSTSRRFTVQMLMYTWTIWPSGQGNKDVVVIKYNWPVVKPFSPSSHYLQHTLNHSTYWIFSKPAAGGGQCCQHI